MRLGDDQKQVSTCDSQLTLILLITSGQCGVRSTCLSNSLALCIGYMPRMSISIQASRFPTSNLQSTSHLAAGCQSTSPRGSADGSKEDGKSGINALDLPRLHEFNGIYYEMKMSISGGQSGSGVRTVYNDYAKYTLMNPDEYSATDGSERRAYKWSETMAASVNG